MTESSKTQQTGKNRTGAVLLCVLLSLLLHFLVVWALLQMPKQEMFARLEPPQKDRAMRYLRVHRPEPPQEELVAEDPEQEQTEPERPFAKTNPDDPERRALDAEYVGARNTTAASAPDSGHLRQDRQAPAMDGKEQEETLEILQQERQDGDIASEQKKAVPHPALPTPDIPTPARPTTALVPPGVLPAAGKPDGEPDTPSETGEQTETLPAESTAALQEQETTPDGQLHITRENNQPTAELQQTSPARSGSAKSYNGRPRKPGAANQTPVQPPHPASPETAADPPGRQPVYDPSLPAHMQPGFRTFERRSRSTGTFIVGRNPSLSVEATPRGRYEALLYRLIARSWYRACDEHRGDIIPGTLTISVSLNKQGRIHNLQLYGRRGASVLQQSFTFSAIRRAALPPMPAAVQKETDGDLVEMLITFHFD